MDTTRLIEVAPHYVAMLLLVYLALAIVEFTVGDLGFLVDLVITAAVVPVHRPVMMRLGLGPSAREQQ